MNMNALLIYSGGLNSTTLLHEYEDCIRLAVTFDYGSKHNVREIACAVENCRDMRVDYVLPGRATRRGRKALQMLWHLYGA